MENPKILIVEDDKETLELLISILGNFFGDLIEGTQGAEEALKLIKTNEYDLVILDIKLGELNGLDIIREVKKEKELPDILIVTAWDSKQVALEAIDAGALDYMPKPIDARIFVEKVKQILEKKNS